MGSSFETERLIARRWQAEDAESLAEIYGDIRVMRFLGAEPKTHTPEEVREFLASRVEMQKDWPDSRGSWAVVVKETGKLIGATILKAFPEGQGAPEVEVGYHFAFDAWGKGYATEICRATILRTFEMEPDFQTLYAVAYKDNEKSLNVLRKSGMEYLGETDQFYGKELCTFRLTRDQLSYSNS